MQIPRVVFDYFQKVCHSDRDVLYNIYCHSKTTENCTDQVIWNSWLCKDFKFVNDRDSVPALEYDRVDLFEKLQLCCNGFKFPEKTKWRHTYRCERFGYTGALAIKHGNFKYVKWFKENGCSFLQNSFGAAAHRGDLELMKWLKSVGDGSEFIWNESTFHAAAECGNLENMKWLKEAGCPWNIATFHAAARHGNLENMKWLKKAGCPWGSSTFFAAFLNGNLENMKWLRFGEAEPLEDSVLPETGCPWDARVFCSAARFGNLEIIKWLHESGCPWDERTIKSALDNGNQENVEWIKKNMLFE